MLHRYINRFLEYFQLTDFAVRSIQALTARLNEFEACLEFQKIRSIKSITYRHLLYFVADHKYPYCPADHFKIPHLWPGQNLPTTHNKSYKYSADG